MEKLDLTYNRVDDEGAGYLTTCLHNVKRLDISAAFLSEKVIKSLVKNLAGCQVVSR